MGVLMAIAAKDYKVFEVIEFVSLVLVGCVVDVESRARNLATATPTLAPLPEYQTANILPIKTLEKFLVWQAAVVSNLNRKPHRVHDVWIDH
jgi:hypothetical protein